MLFRRILWLFVGGKRPKEALCAGLFVGLFARLARLQRASIQLL